MSNLFSPLICSDRGVVVLVRVGPVPGRVRAAEHALPLQGAPGQRPQGDGDTGEQRDLLRGPVPERYGSAVIKK